MSNFNKDYLMRMLDDMNKMAARLMLKKVVKEDELRSTVEAGDGDMLPLILKGLVNEGNIDPAENLLFRFSELYPTRELFQVGLDFYAYLNKMEDEELTKAGWDRKEIHEGLTDFAALFPPEEKE